MSSGYCNYELKEDEPFYLPTTSPILLGIYTNLEPIYIVNVLGNIGIQLLEVTVIGKCSRLYLTAILPSREK